MISPPVQERACFWSVSNCYAAMADGMRPPLHAVTISKLNQISGSPSQCPKRIKHAQCTKRRLHQSNQSAGNRSYFTLQPTPLLLTKRHTDTQIRLWKTQYQGLCHMTIAPYSKGGGGGGGGSCHRPHDLCTLQYQGSFYSTRGHMTFDSTRSGRLLEV